MRILLAALLAHAAVFPSFSAQAEEKLPCPAQAPDEPLVYMSDFSWGQSLESMRAKFSETYASGKRLKGRAHLDADDAYVVPRPTGLIRLTPEFLRSVRRHIEIALERRYADFIFFPDMGHSHFFIPEAEWDAIAAIPGERQHEAYTKMVALPTLQVLYHTAEQLAVREGARGAGAFPQDKTLLWRYFSRNPIGDNTTGENVAPHFAFHNDNYNTLHELKGHRSWSAGFSISASKDGCFQYTAPDGREMRFDLSFEDLPYGKGGDDSIGSLRRWKAHMKEFGVKPVR